VNDGRIYGRRPVLEALEAGREFNRVLIARGSAGSLGRVVALARERGIPVQEVTKDALDRASGGGNHQGVVGFVSPLQYVDVADVVAKARGAGEDPFLVVLDGITDPQNLGSVIRTANAAGAHGVIVPARRGALVSPAVVRASAGATEYTPVARVTNLARAIDFLKEEGLWVVGTDPEAGHFYHEPDLTGPLAVVIGSEGEGISRLVREKCDLLVAIPMVGKVGSLNAGVAWGVLAYEILKQRSRARLSQ
jgi:23S rRNA (guanosine2251-2'-O)-methyltransferase